MPTITIAEFKAALEALNGLASLFDAISIMRSEGLLSDAEEAQLKVRLRTKVRTRIDEIVAADSE